MSAATIATKCLGLTAMTFLLVTFVLGIASTSLSKWSKTSITSSATPNLVVRSKLGLWTKCVETTNATGYILIAESCTTVSDTDINNMKPKCIGMFRSSRAFSVITIVASGLALMLYPIVDFAVEKPILIKLWAFLAVLLTLITASSSACCWGLYLAFARDADCGGLDTLQQPWVIMVVSSGFAFAGLVICLLWAPRALLRAYAPAPAAVAPLSPVFVAKKMVSPIQMMSPMPPNV